MVDEAKLTTAYRPYAQAQYSEDRAGREDKRQRKKLRRLLEEITAFYQQGEILTSWYSCNVDICLNCFGRTPAPSADRVFRLQ